MTKGGPGPAVLGPGQGVPCGANTPTCRYLDIELRGGHLHGVVLPRRLGNRSAVDVLDLLDHRRRQRLGLPQRALLLNFAKLTANGAYVTVSRTGTDTVRSTWLK